MDLELNMALVLQMNLDDHVANSSEVDVSSVSSLGDKAEGGHDEEDHGRRISAPIRRVVPPS